MVLAKIPVNLKQKCRYATRQPVFLSQHSEMQVHTLFFVSKLVMGLIKPLWNSKWVVTHLPLT